MIGTIRLATEEDVPTIESIAVAAGMFLEEEVGFLGEQFRDQGGGARWLVAEQDGAVVGSAYYAPEPFADRMWNLYFIAVAPEVQGQGLGKWLMRHVEGELRSQGDKVARTIVVETSSTEQYEATRAFYTHIGYTEEARIRQFYGPDDDKIVFWKLLAE